MTGGCGEMTEEEITYKDMVRMMYGGSIGTGNYIMDAWSVRRVWPKRLFGWLVRKWRFNETYIRTADGKIHKTGPI